MAPGKRRTVLQIANSFHADALVVSDGRHEAAIRLGASSSPSAVTRAVKAGWHPGTTGSIEMHENGSAFFIPISTACAWRIGVFVETLSGNPRPLFLKALSPEEVHHLRLGFDAVASSVQVSPDRAVEIARQALPRWRGRVWQALVARVHAGRPGIRADGQLCWVLVASRPRAPQLRLIFIDAHSGRFLGVYQE